jgi:hypothetical protein
LIPTAAQKTRPAHETAVKAPDDPETIGTVVEVQPEPFQNSASGTAMPLTFCCPTSMQFEDAPHETLSGVVEVAPVGTGRFVIVQDEPFHCSVIRPGDCPPTAMHHETERHETPASNAEDVVEAFTRTTDHMAPFHCSIRGDRPPEKSANPTATQNEVVTHETSVRRVDVADVTVGSVSSGDHVVPFHI